MNKYQIIMVYMYYSGSTGERRKRNPYENWDKETLFHLIYIGCSERNNYAISNNS
jgi:hypothetical protein